MIMAPLSHALKPRSEPIQPQGETTGIGRADIRVKGKTVSVPSAQIEGKVVTTSGRFLKIASVRDEELVEGDTVEDPESFVSQLKANRLKVDLFTFAQRLPDTAPKHNYHIEWENAAALPITTYSRWWKECTEYSIRKGVNRAKKLGLLVKTVEFDDVLLEAIYRIYNETPVRQGKSFWHFGKDFELIRRALATYLERSFFIGAYWQDELVGFMKVTSVNGTATITQILSAQKHFSKRPNNALIAKAVEICEFRHLSPLIYGSFVYYDPDSSLTEFKRRNGFQAIPLPRYYIPLTLKGKIALRLRLQRGIAGNIPTPIFREFLKIRKAWYARRSKDVKETP